VKVAIVAKVDRPQEVAAAKEAMGRVARRLFPRAVQPALQGSAVLRALRRLPAYLARPDLPDFRVLPALLFLLRNQAAVHRLRVIRAVCLPEA
jgi:hypothetical protein